MNDAKLERRIIAEKHLTEARSDEAWVEKRAAVRSQGWREMNRAARVCRCLQVAILKGDEKKIKHWQKISMDHYQIVPERRVGRG